MPQASSKKQYRFMQAILHGKNVKENSRGNPPKSVASKYMGSSQKGLPESKDNDKGGTWGAGAHKNAKKKVDAKRLDRKKRKAKVKKSFESYYDGRGAGCVVINDKGQVLVGTGSKDRLLQTPGGHVDLDEGFEEGAKRELYEEAGITANQMIELGVYNDSWGESRSYLVREFSGKPKSVDGELKNLKWMDVHEAAEADNLRFCSRNSLDMYLKSHLKKSLKDLVAIEALEKNILRGADGRTSVLDVSHGESLKLIGNGTFRMLREAVRGMTEESFKEVSFDDHVIVIRKHLNDVYSGRINSGNKMVHQFTNKSLPQLSVELMSVFEWYLPEDEPDLDMLEEDDLCDDVIEGGLTALVDNYKKHNLANIYSEMDNIRKEIRNTTAVDLMRVEDKITKLFDKLEEHNHEIVDKHNKLCNDADEEILMLENKLKELQVKIDQLDKKPVSVEAYSASPVQSSKVHDEHYFYMSKPNVIIEPNGRIKITFGEEWNAYDRENFLHDLKVKAIKK